ncbi:Uncharacterized protein APZ42_026599 [Daphnia magna]|uniref:Uncharacterized protein n=1 Tax=Daphnia magna TaxID=35525 RepID=A0A164S4D0_9CRUS|nr:Uncharacterized protein APZ42_026599 [Daphnia magna]
MICFTICFKINNVCLLLYLTQYLSYRGLKTNRMFQKPCRTFVLSLSKTRTNVTHIQIHRMKTQMEQHHRNLIPALLSSINEVKTSIFLKNSFEEPDMYFKHFSNLKELSKYPTVQKIYKRFNIALQSSASVERLISQGGLIYVPKRTNLIDKSFEMLLPCGPYNTNADSSTVPLFIIISIFK